MTHGRRASQPLAPITLPSDPGPWIRVRTAHFDIISAAGDARTKQVARNFETLAAVLAQLHPRFTAPPSRTRVLMFTRRRDIQPYFDMLTGQHEVRVGGLFVLHPSGGTMIIDAGQNWRSDRTPFHELVHDLLSASGQRRPLWIEEGIADYFSNAQIGQSKIRLGTPIFAHALLLRRRGPMPLADLFAVKHETREGINPRFYAQSWAAVDWLFRTNQVAFYDFLDDIESGVAVEASLKKHYNKTLRDLERGIAGTGRSRPFYMSVTRRNEQIEVQQLTRADLLHQLGRFLRNVQGAQADADRHFRAALEIDPKHPRSLAAMGRWDEALAAAPNDVETHLDAAEALMKNTIGRFAQVFEPEPSEAPKFRRARELAQRALELGGESSRAWGLVGTSYLTERDEDLEPGIIALEKSRLLGRSRNDFALHLYSFYLRHGDRLKAEALYSEKFEGSEDLQIIFAAANIRLRVDLDRASKLARAGKLVESAALIREVAAATPDDTIKEGLEEQAVKIDLVVERNVQITQYNQAISEVNRGDRKAALTTLNHLLSIATDESVIRDATALQSKLKGRNADQ